MSHVTDTILSMSILEDWESRIKEVNKYFDDDVEDCHTNGFVEKELPHEVYGGHKVLQAYIFIGAFNYLGIDELIKHIKSISWESPENLQIILQDENDDKFRIIEPFGEENQKKEV